MGRFWETVDQILKPMLPLETQCCRVFLPIPSHFAWSEDGCLAFDNRSWSKSVVGHPTICPGASGLFVIETTWSATLESVATFCSTSPVYDNWIGYGWTKTIWTSWQAIVTLEYFGILWVYHMIWPNSRRSDQTPVVHLSQTGGGDFLVTRSDARKMIGSPTAWILPQTPGQKETSSPKMMLYPMEKKHHLVKQTQERLGGLKIIPTPLEVLTCDEWNSSRQGAWGMQVLGQIA